MLTNLYSLHFLKMKYLVLVSLCLLVTLQEGEAVRSCYKCENADCNNETISSVNCAEDLNIQDTAYLCESRVDKETVKKGCILNTSEDIDNCDALNEDEQGTVTKCYYCDRELCNSASLSVALTTLLTIGYCIISVF